MKVLFVTNMYPTKEHPVDGVFVKEQIDSITQAFKCQYDLYYINAKRKGKLNYLISLLALPLKIKSARYHIIHIHYGISGLFLLLFKPKTSKVFLTLHGGDILEKQGYFMQVFLTKRILSKVDKVFLQNEEMKDIVKEYNKNYEIIPCGVNSEFFRPMSIPGKAGANTRLIVFPSSPDREEKNFQLFADTMRHLSERSSYDIEFDCLHNLSRSEVRELLNRAACLLLTSISEGSPQVVKEALFCGLPIVSVPVGDVEQMLDGIPHCHVSKTFSPVELSSLVDLSLDCKSQIIREAFIKKGYDQVSIARRLTESYKAVLNV